MSINISMSNSHKIIIKNARVNNLKNISLEIPLNKFIVITGVSGSGKSSLAFETLFAEGQRRYVESLSSYARQFLSRMNKPDVDFISGIPPAIAIEQKTITTNPRSTVGTSSEIHEYLKLLFARIGKTFSPVSGKEVKKHSVKDVINFITQQNNYQFGFIAFENDENFSIHHYIQQGYTRAFFEDSFIRLEFIEDKNIKSFLIVVDRFENNIDNDTINRLSDSIETALFEGLQKFSLTNLKVMVLPLKSLIRKCSTLIVLLVLAQLAKVLDKQLASTKTLLFQTKHYRYTTMLLPVGKAKLCKNGNGN
jgi:excinuclease ABC subunit A